MMADVEKVELVVPPFQERHSAASARRRPRRRQRGLTTSTST